MTLRKAERVTGCEITCTNGVWAAHENGELLCVNTERKEKLALHLLVEEVLSIRRRRVMERDGYRCVRCGSRGPLHAHHKVSRAKGRDDREDNLETICTKCHDKEHRGFSR